MVERLGRSVSDFRLDPGFLKHPKTQKLARRIGADAPLRLIELWGWAVDNRPTGELTGMDVEDIAIAAGCAGDAAAFVDALVELRWLDVSDDCYALHNWSERQPWVAGAEERSAAATRLALSAWHKRGLHAEHAKPGCPECDAHAPRKRPARGKQAGRYAPLLSSPSPSPTLTSTKPTEEEEKAPAAPDSASPPATSEPSAPTDAQKLVNHAIQFGLRGVKLGRREYGKHANHAATLLADHPLEWWLTAARGMDTLWQYRNGETWDVFNLGRDGTRAYAEATAPRKPARAAPVRRDGFMTPEQMAERAVRIAEQNRARAGGSGEP